MQFKFRLYIYFCRSQRILKSEVEQLDDAFSKIFKDEPQQSMIDNLKKKHGLLVNNNSSKYERFDEKKPEKSNSEWEKINVEAFREKMNRARIIDNLPNDTVTNENSRRRASLSVIGQALPRKPGPDITVDKSPKQKRTGAPSIDQMDKSE